MPLEIIGAGYGRTGTMGLKNVLEQLGFNKCYHMIEVFEHLDTAVPFWQDAADGKSVDWEQHFKGFRAAVDWPSSAFWKELADFYPDAKVILSTRTPESWYKSFSNTIMHHMMTELDPAETPPEMLAWSKMAKQLIRHNTFHDRLADADYMIQAFKDHEQQVKDTIAPERLLIFNSADGWEPLCAFLGVPVPDEPYPLVNTTEDFRKRFSQEDE
ncbi:MAG: sulfotransferase family protein [Alphaproteobacteria bacterium]|nr:MAG: sulfotransferase family protein [Alphaproteobacteria bacterium]